MITYFQTIDNRQLHVFATSHGILVLKCIKNQWVACLCFMNVFPCPVGFQRKLMIKRVPIPRNVNVTNWDIPTSFIVVRKGFFFFSRPVLLHLIPACIAYKYEHQNVCTCHLGVVTEANVAESIFYSTYSMKTGRKQCLIILSHLMTCWLEYKAVV